MGVFGKTPWPRLKICGLPFPLPGFSPRMTQSASQAAQIKRRGKGRQ